MVTLTKDGMLYVSVWRFGVIVELPLGQGLVFGVYMEEAML